jgi:CBS domain containing-hemolysin-like protein
MTGQDILLRLLSVFWLIAINAFFVTAEFSLVSVRRSRISQLVEEGDIQAQTVQSLQRSIDHLLSTTQFGITLSSLALGWIGERTMAVLLNTAIEQLPLSPSLTTSLSHAVAVPLAFFLLAYLQIVLGELCPKSVALLYAEQLARFLGPSIGVIARIFKPFLWILNCSTRRLLSLVGIKASDRDWYSRVTSEELQHIIAREGESTGLAEEEREMLQNVFEFKDVMAVEVMVPRALVVAIPKTATLLAFLKEVTATGYSLYPVKRDSLDDICGILDFKDLALPLAEGQIETDSPIEPWIKAAQFIPESMLLSEVLSLMQRSHLKMVIVVDEFGGTSGLITLQDIIAEILGDAVETGNSETMALQQLDEQTYLVQAQMNLEEVNDLLNLDLPLADEYQTLGGFLLYQWQKIPTQGETLIYGDLEFTVVLAKGPRLLQIRLHRYQTLNDSRLPVPDSPSLP